MRISVDATPATGLSSRSFAMLDRITTAPREKIGRIIGRADDATMLAVNRGMAVFLGLA
jgi:mRNA interferase MazF